jgi:hypothetical protein
VGELFESGRVVDLLLAFMVLEAVALWAYRRASGRGIPSIAVAASLASGACLLLALRAALTTAGWEWIALWLTAALAAHLTDLRWRWGT